MCWLVRRVGMLMMEGGTLVGGNGGNLGVDLFAREENVIKEIGLGCA
jgi:hypothetical protein